MDLQITREADKSSKAYIVDQMIQFNLRHFPDEYKGRYQELNLYLKDSAGQVFGGLVSEVCTIENAGSYTHYYMKKDI